MSGGSYEYFYIKLEMFLDQVESEEDGTLTKERRDFIELMRLASSACKAIEWVDSGDRSEGGDKEDIEKVFKRAMEIGKENNFFKNCKENE